MSLMGKYRSMKRMSNKDVQKIIHSVLFGCINAIMCIPVMISFTSIIFRDDAYREVLPSLIKIVLFSCMIHQISFSIFSGLTFAVGQVQDAGLIFLSAMASSIVSGCKSPESIVPTTLVVLSTYTALLGVMLILLGKMKLASVVQYLPLPVIGGYLAYIGFFCGQAGLAMMAGVEISAPSDWSKLLNEKCLLLILPGLLLGCVQYIVLRTVKSAFTLPACMATVLTVFYLVLYASGASLQDARNHGWIAEMAPEIPFYKAWDLFRLDRIEFSLILPQFPKFVAMVLVVAFSSSLDVAAIEMELGLPLDYNRELQTVGISNLFSGLTGGYTGSYIFSQTLFSLRRGVKSRLAGAVLAMGELAIIALPISVTSYLPKMFFGSMLVLISVDLMWEWLVMAAAKMMGTEYAVCLATFLAIMAAGIETGMAIGVLLSMISFVVVYAKLPAMSSSSLLLRSSTVVRSYEERCALLSRANRGKIVTISLKGYVFFGSAVKILEEVKSRVILTAATDGPTPTPTHVQLDREGSQVQSQVEAPVPMFSFLMNRMGAKDKESFAEGEEEKDKDKEGYARLTRKSLEPMYSGKSNSNSISSSRISSSKGSASAAYAPLASSDRSGSPYRARGDDEDSNVDEEEGRTTSSKSTGRHSQRPLPPRSKAIPVRIASSAVAHSEKERERGMESMLAGSPLQSLSAYDMNQDQLSSYQRRWMQERDLGALAAPIHLLSHSGSMQSLTQPRQELQSQIPSDAPHTGRRGTRSGSVGSYPQSQSQKNIQDMMCSESSEKSKQGQDSFNDPLPYPKNVAPSRSEDLKASTLSSSLARFAGLQSEGSQSANQSEKTTSAPAPKVATRTQSMSQLLSSASSLTSMSILSAVWSSQGRRRERAKLLSATGEGSNGKKDNERRSKSYDSLSIAMSGIKGGQDTLNLSREFPILPLVDFESGQVPLKEPPPLPPLTPGMEKSYGAETEPTEFLILDFTEVLGIDATSARSCFLMLVHLMRSSGVTVVFAAMSQGMEKLLVSHGVIRRTGRDGDEVDIVIPTADGALEWCENQILSGGSRDYPRSYYSGREGEGGGACPASSSSSLRALRRILQEHLEIEEEEEGEREWEGADIEDSDLRRHSLSPHTLLDTKSLSMFFKRQEVLAGDVVFDVGHRADKVYFIEAGAVEILVAGEGARCGGQPERVNKISVGGIFGEAAFFLDLPHSVRCVSLSEKCMLWTLDRDSYLQMEISHPSLCLLVQHTLLKSLSISSTSALHALHPSAAYSIMFE